jgi:hypothetical protein
MDYEQKILQKEKYFEKTLSNNAIYLNITRTIDVAPLFASDVWLNITWMDFTVTGIGLLNSITPIELEPLNIAPDYRSPYIEEMMQGIWVVLKGFDLSKIYSFMTNLRDFVTVNFSSEFLLDILKYLLPKAMYGIARYGEGLYDPAVATEFLRSTFYRLRLLRKTDKSYLDAMANASEKADIVSTAKDHIFNREFLIASAQEYAFVLGLGVLGKSRLTQTQDGWGVIPTKTSDGKVYDVKFRTLDHLQYGFILGLTPLRYGLLLPRKSIYQLPEGKENPPIIDVITNKARKISRSLGLTALAYGNYNKPEEMTDYHKSERTTQYDQLMTDRRLIEEWVEKQIPPEEANPVRIRQYKNAVLQLISWKAKRHAWGYNGWEAMTEDQFKAWWIDNWKQQSLNETTLNNLYEGIKKWLPMLRERKLDLGKKVKETRQRLALLQRVL